MRQLLRILNKLTAAARHSYTYNNIDTNNAAENVQLTQIMYLSSFCEQRDPAKELFYKVQRSVPISCANQPIPACKSIANSIRCSTNLPQQAALHKSSLSTSLRRMTQNWSAFPKWTAQPAKLWHTYYKVFHFVIFQWGNVEKLVLNGVAFLDESCEYPIEFAILLQAEIFWFVHEISADLGTL